MKLRKVMIIGVGNVGSTTAYTLVNRGICEEIVLVDINKERTYGHAQDLLDAAAYRQNMIKVSLRESTDCADIDIAIITVTSGLAQKSRAEELAGTSKIVATIVPDMMKNGFKGIFLVATNPCDAITYQVWQLSGLPRHRVIGTGVWLDTVRLRRLLGEQMDIGPQSIDAFIVGEHGDSQFPVWSHSSVYGINLNHVEKNRIDFNDIGSKAKNKGFEIAKFKHCTEYGIASTITEICQHIFTNSHRALALSCILNGEYGYKDVAIGVPAILDQHGIKKIIELDFSDNEKQLFKNSIEIIKGYIAHIK
ncbi:MULTISPECIES: L-lactate dehydrogenase [unclassified Gilliamella]|uniref:L-lactate dehydrogenase n=1 Tax=unclassified Gilliamella TaxID=2685620 RepID=UPI00226A5FCA|nr:MULTISPECIES: L-lactate dehydrogenase [unclassified Gilliamella]MCX8600645.1 L-lactate dehydrogenase [Gilliamella sp. B3722]MCX8609185.1 L-lactate dehydrogenase [Gilliamella sp. B3771]MCX8609862.1 L-lactate dehydrogenase [Gilliamella sp. B3891]MCX8612048.1 L-lactate dehydrogenase [Gilliamella sp. B3773]MCX8615552.1 L-lactate dehydrogenase [Gilliamella sp. B3770]